MTPLIDMICIESAEPISKLHNVIKETQPLAFASSPLPTRVRKRHDKMNLSGSVEFPYTTCALTTLLVPWRQWWRAHGTCMLDSTKQGVVSMKTLLKNANCLEDFVSDNTKKVQEICDIPVFVPELWFAMTVVLCTISLRPRGLFQNLRRQCR